MSKIIPVQNDLKVFMESTTGHHEYSIHVNKDCCTTLKGNGQHGQVDVSEKLQGPRTDNIRLFIVVFFAVL